MTPKTKLALAWGPYRDNMRLNVITEPDHNAMPNISDCLTSHPA